MDAVVLLVGDELLEGHTRDANLPWLAEQMEAMGHGVARAEVLPDDDALLVPALREAAEEADVVLVTGGLGPTHDDRTREAAAEAFDLDLAVDEEALEELEGRYREHFTGGEAPAENVIEAGERMCTVPAEGRTLPNRTGAALGFAVRARGADVVALPGVPREMRDMFERSVAGAIVPDEGAREHVEEAVVDLPEAEFSDVLSALQEANPDVGVGSYPHADEPRVTVRVRGAEGDVEACLADLRDRLDPDLILDG